MQNAKRKAIAAAILSAAIATGAWAGGALSSTQAGISTSPGTHALLKGRKAGTPQQEYLLAGVSTSPGGRLLAIPGVRGTGGGTGRS